MAPGIEFEHIHMLCADISVMDQFLIDGLGAKINLRRETDGYKNWEYSLGNVQLFLSENSGGSAAAAGLLDHLGFSVTDITAAIEHLQSHGCVVLEGPTAFRDDLTFAYLEGPEGLRIELLQRS